MQGEEMKSRTYIKQLIRTPFKTLITITIMTLLTFMLFARFSEYTLISNEMASVSKKYQGVGNIQAIEEEISNLNIQLYIYADPRMEKNLTEDELLYYRDALRVKEIPDEVMAIVRELPFISSFDYRYMTKGLSSEFPRLHETRDFYSYHSTLILEANISEIVFSQENKSYYDETNLSNIKVLAGDSSFVRKETIEVLSYFELLEDHQSLLISNNYVDNSLKVDSNYLRSLDLNERYIFVVQYNPNADPVYYTLGNYLINKNWQPITKIEMGVDDYLNLDEFETLNRLIEMVNSDMYTHDMVYTSDLSSIMEFANGNLSIVEGRAINEALDNNLYQCVINQEVAEKYDISLRDMLEFRLGRDLFEPFKGLGAISSSLSRYDLTTEEVALEVVGIYAETGIKQDRINRPHFHYSKSTFFLPTALLGTEASQIAKNPILPSEFSFVVGNPWDIEEFSEIMEETNKALSEYGYQIKLEDGGWLALKDQFEDSKKTAIYTLMSTLIAVAFASALVVYLYVGRKKRDYAIMRALGTEKKICMRSIVIPIALIVGISLILGIGLAWITLGSSLGQYSISGGYELSHFPIEVVMYTLFIQVFLFSLFLLYALRQLSRVSTLALLQDVKYLQKKRKNFKQKHAENTILAADERALNLNYSIPTSKSRHFKMMFYIKYTLKIIRRSYVKSILIMTLVVILTILAGELSVMEENYYDLAQNTVVESKFLDGITLSSVSELINNKIIEDVYYEYEGGVDLNHREINVVITNDISRYADLRAKFTFALNYSENTLNNLGNVGVVSKEVFERFNLSLGENALLSENGIYPILVDLWLGNYKRDHPYNKLSDDEILESKEKDLNLFLQSMGRTIKIVGYVEFEDNQFSNYLFLPGFSNTKKAFGYEVPLAYLEGNLVDNFKIDDYRKVSNLLISRDDPITFSRTRFVMNTDKVDGIIDSLDTIEKISPVVKVLSIFLVNFIVCLILLQMTKDVAVMRLLGTKGAYVRFVMILESFILCLMGAVTGILALWIFEHKMFKVIRLDLFMYLLYFMIIYIMTSVITSFIVSNKNILKKLQTKE